MGDYERSKHVITEENIEQIKVAPEIVKEEGDDLIKPQSGWWWNDGGE